MTEYNYLPAIKHARLSVAGFNRQAPFRVDLDLGGQRAYLSDVAFHPTTNSLGWGQGNEFTVSTVLARVGIYGHEVLTEDFYPLAIYGNKVRQEFGVWEFPKPYRLYPGEKLSAFVGYDAAASGRDVTVPAVQFNGVRVVDERPILLHDNTFVAMPAGQSTRLVAEKLQCPADSPVDLYSCVLQPNSSLVTNGITTMIYGPDGRKWWDDENWVWLFDTPGFLLDLNKPEWVLGPGESFYCEFITPTTSCDLEVVLRGQIEVSK